MLGFSSGLPLALVSGTLQAWFKVSGADIVVIGYLGLLGQPYSYKFFWAPILDKFKVLPGLDIRRGWILTAQVAITLAIMMMAFLAPDMTMRIPFVTDKFPVLCTVGIFLAFFSASQDIAIDAYRVEILEPQERGLGAALAVEGYRGAMLVSGGFALVLADQIGWQNTYLVMGSLMLIGILGVGLGPSVARVAKEHQESLAFLVKQSFMDFLTREKALWFLALIILYKLGDVFAHALSTAFLLDLSFSLSEVGVINKTLGLIASLIGVFFGGLLMVRIGLFKSLLLFGVLSTVTNLLYMLLAITGKHYYLACGAFFVESLCGGMGTAALVALLMSLCNPKYTATQYALFTSLTALGRIYVAPVSGHIVAAAGWTWFFAFSAVAAAPGLLLLMYLKSQIDKRDVSAAELTKQTDNPEPKLTGKEATVH